MSRTRSLIRRLQGRMEWLYRITLATKWRKPRRAVYLNGNGRSGYAVILALFPPACWLCWWYAGQKLELGWVLFWGLMPFGALFGAMRWWCGSPDSARLLAQAIAGLSLPEDLPAYVEGKLLPHERVVSACRDHPVVLLMPSWWAAAWLGLLAIGAGSEIVFHKFWIAAAFAVPAVIGPGLRYWSWRCRMLVLTEKRLMRITYDFSAEVAMLPIGKLTDAIAATGFVSRTLSYWRITNLPWMTLHVTTAGQNHPLSVAAFVPGGSDMYMAIMRVLFPSEE